MLSVVIPLNPGLTQGDSSAPRSLRCENQPRPGAGGSRENGVLAGGEADLLSACGCVEGVKQKPKQGLPCVPSSAGKDKTIN